MDCQTAETQLSAWLNDELSEAAGAAPTAHLEGCEACREEWRQLTARTLLWATWRRRRPWGWRRKWRRGFGGPAAGRRLQSAALAACLILGIALGGTMARSFYSPATSNEAGVEVASLEVFRDFPQGSLGVVVALISPKKETVPTRELRWLIYLVMFPWR